MGLQKKTQCSGFNKTRTSIKISAKFLFKLKEAKSYSQDMKNGCKFGKRCFENLENGGFKDGVDKKKFRSADGGCKARALEIRKALFQWFVEVTTKLKARLPKALFLLQAKKLYVDWLQKCSHTPEEEQFKFSNLWIKGLEIVIWSLSETPKETLFNFQKNL